MTARHIRIWIWFMWFRNYSFHFFNMIVFVLYHFIALYQRCTRRHHQRVICLLDFNVCSVFCMKFIFFFICNCATHGLGNTSLFVVVSTRSLLDSMDLVVDR